MEHRQAKELLHIRAWLNLAAEIVRRGRREYLNDALLQEAGDSLMMKLGEAAKRLSTSGYFAPESVDWASALANRNWLIHRYDELDRALTWMTLSADLASWQSALSADFDKAEHALGLDQVGQLRDGNIPISQIE